jgi:hypothetical protein
MDGRVRFTPGDFATVFPLELNSLGTVLAVKGPLRRAKQRRALDRSGPFQNNPS